ncbi:MAG: hypothetical protein ACRC57_01765, partial [Sarcina sp.]
QVYYELKKLCNKTSILAVILMIGICVVPYLIMMNHSSNNTAKGNGEVVTGIRAYKVLREEASDIKGNMDQKYLTELVKRYNSSKEKEIYKTNLQPYIKYKYPNFFINFVNYGSEMGNFYMDLDYEFLNDEEKFYIKYKATVEETIQNRNDNIGIVPYSDKQKEKISKLVQKIKTPFIVGYEEGIEHFIYSYGEKYWVVLLVIGFCLSSLFSKNSVNGIDQLSLSTTLGRRVNMNARVIAGNVFSIGIYFIFIFSLFIIISLVAGFDGLNLSAQIFWNLCPYSIKLWQGVVILLFMGLLGTLIISNLIMLISLIISNYKVSTITNLLVLGLLVKFTQTTKPLILQLNPIFFSTHFTTSNLADFEIFYFIGEIMIPYSFIVIVLFTAYMMIIRFLTVKSYKNYKITY